MLRTSFGLNHTQPLDVLCLGAHCDDIEIGCGGTLLRLLGERPGSRVRWVVFAGNAQRAAEARASASDFLVQAGTREIEVQSFKESHFPYVGAEIKAYFEQLKQKASPDLIFSHHVKDRHQDHRTIAELTWNTFRNHLIVEYEIPKYEGDLGQPNLFVPLPRALAARKVELILKHFQSQATRSWFRADTFEAIMSLRGIECAADDGRAEAFHASKLTL
jgi:LmbE family N-acetylglucosaminyl deacetylase